jgi:two-component system, sensor histidine kinase and response regulator
LLENLLEWASLQTGRINLTPEKLDLGNMISKTVSVHQLMLSEKKIELNQYINTLDYGYADKDTLNVVLRNLISNAIKFTPKGGRIDVSVNRQSGDSGQGELIVKVKDTGIGIAGSDLENIFNLNKKKRTAGTEKETGTGLGLVLCKEFVEKNGGRLFVESKPGEGSTFGFTVPAAVRTDMV